MMKKKPKSYHGIIGIKNKLKVMCLYSITNIPSIADEDIKCYKVLLKKENEFYSPVIPLFKYKIGEINKPNKLFEYDSSIAYDGTYLISVGYLHCLRVDGLNSLNIKNTIQCNIFASLDNFTNHFIAECYIPKGSKYYIGEGFDGDICSDKLFVSDKIVNVRFYKELI